ncbi:MAG: amino acid permease, partial [Synechococcaceae cyanobacterium]|nr:amino acid permease [Synechococcaceae cyanobacterium]
FTLSQAGMVVRWWRLKAAGWQGRLLMNALGALTTLVVLLVIVISKFAEGAWTVVIAIPLLVWFLGGIRQRYRRVFAVIGFPPDHCGRVTLPARSEPVGNRSLVWVASLTRPSIDALRYAARVSDEVIGVWVRSEDEDPQRIRADWQRLVGDSPGMRLEILESPYASLIDPFVAFVEAQEDANPDLTTTIVMPMAIPRYRFDGLLLNQRGLNMRQALDASGNRVFTLVRYYLPA